MTRHSRKADILFASLVLSPALLGFLSLVGWHFGHWNWVKLLPHLPIFPYFSVLSFWILSLAILACLVGARKTSLSLAAIPILYGVICGQDMILHAGPNIPSLIFLSKPVPEGNVVLTAISSYHALCLILGGLGVVLMCLNKSNPLFPYRSVLLASIGAILMAMSTMSFLSSLTWLTSLESWTRLARHLAQVPLPFLLVGAILVAHAWLYPIDGFVLLPRWIPIPTAMTLLTCSILFWESLSAHERVLREQTIELQTDAIRNEILSNTQFTLEALKPLIRRWETWKNPNQNLLQSDVGIFVKHFEGCIAVDRIDSNLKRRWWVEVKQDFSHDQHKNYSLEIQKILLDSRLQIVQSGGHSRQLILDTFRLGEQHDILVVSSPVLNQNKFDGFVHVIFDLQEFLRHIFTNKIAPGYQISIYKTGQLIFTKAASSGPLLNAAWTREAPFVLGNEIWHIRTTPSEQENGKMSSPIPQFALSGGILFSLLFTVMVYLAQQTHLRSGSIRTTNEELQREIQVRKTVEAELEKARDAAIESARLKADFVANISHEIRTPMNGIIGMTGLLIESELAPRQREYAEMIRTSGSALLTIINDILDFSKIEAGKLSFETQEFNPQEVIEDVLDIFAESIRSKNLDLIAASRENLPEKVRGDPGRLRQILVNLVGNAVKFTEQGHVIVNARAESLSDDHVQLHFSIQDTGIGISEKETTRLFESFSQIHHATTRKYAGTGLGLAICRQLVKQMHGDIGFSSVPDKGSEFWFTVRMDRVENPTVTEPHADLKSKKLLLLEDNLQIQSLLQHLFQAHGIAVECIGSGQDLNRFLDQPDLSKSPPDWILVDLQFPGEDFHNLPHRLIGPSKKTKPCVIAMSYLSKQNEMEKLRLAGFAGLVIKPLKFSRILRQLEQLVTDPDTSLWETDSTNDADLPEETTRGTVEKRAHSLRLRILVVEDNAVNQKVAVRMLENLGYTADAVGNGLEALQNLEQVPYDLILMDCEMSEMDGYEASQEIRKRQSGKVRTPIIAMTAHALEGDRAKCLNAGMDDYLSKPFDQQDLKRILSKWIKKKSRSRKKEPTPIVPHSPEPPDAPPLRTQPILEPQTAVEISRLREVCGEDETEIQATLRIYLEQIRIIQQQLQEACAQGDVVEMARLAHKGKGSSRTCGMNEIGHILDLLEQSAASQPVQKNIEAIQNMAEAIDRAVQTLNKELHLTLESKV